MTSKKLRKKFCDPSEDDQINKIKEGVSNILEECKQEIKDALIALTRVADHNVAKCIRHKLPCADIVALESCMDKDVIINPSTAGRFVDLVLRNKKLMVGNSTSISDSGQDFLDKFTSYIQIAGANLDAKTKERKPVKASLAKKERPQLASQDFRKLSEFDQVFRRKKYEAFLQKKADQEEKAKETNQFLAHCNYEITKEKEREVETIQKDREAYESLKEHLFQELEKEQESLENALKTIEHDEDELRKNKEKTENALFIIIDRYDAEIGEKKVIFDDLIREKNLEMKKLEKLKKKFKLQEREYQKALKEEDQWENEDIEKQLNKLRLLIAHRFLKIFLSAYVQSWKKAQPPPASPKKSRKGKD
ncbi:hypothetical protein M8J76_010338 [Diaphorina citri]|nr:hypothetical protein M8J75_014760 [Diaphorina citri]KAI5749809.1 hypothetical protein M8J76_010338 [Diaphorina citri]